jgi:hypothetical protein
LLLLLFEVGAFRDMEGVTGDGGEGGDEVTEAVGVGGNPGTATPG